MVRVTFNLQKNRTDANNFDKDFTQEEPCLTPVASEVVAAINQNEFSGFSYVNDDFGQMYQLGYGNCATTTAAAAATETAEKAAPATGSAGKASVATGSVEQGVTSTGSVGKEAASSTDTETKAAEVKTGVHDASDDANKKSASFANTTTTGGSGGDEKTVTSKSKDRDATGQVQTTNNETASGSSDKTKMAAALEAGVKALTLPKPNYYADSLHIPPFTAKRTNVHPTVAAAATATDTNTPLANTNQSCTGTRPKTQPATNTCITSLKSAQTSSLCNSDDAFESTATETTSVDKDL